MNINSVVVKVGSAIASSMSSASELWLRENTRQHYDRYPLVIVMSKEMERYELERNLIGRFIQGLRGERGLALDLGCGNGRIGKILLDEGVTCIGADISAISLATAAADGLPTVQADACTLPFGNETFKAVVCYGMLHHTPAALEGLAEINRVSAGGANIFLGINRARSLNHIVYVFPGACLRWLRRRGHDRLVKAAFGCYYPFGLLFKCLQTRSLFAYPFLWNQFNDQFLSPRTTFHTAAEILQQTGAWRWQMLAAARSHAGGMWNFWFRKP